MENITIDKIIEELKKLDNFSKINLKREYEKKISDLSKKIDYNMSKELIDYNFDDDFINFSKLFMIFTFYRHNKFLTEIENLMDNYITPYYDDIQIYPHINLMYLATTTKESSKTIFEYAKEYKKIPGYSNYVGFINNYVEACISYYENNIYQSKELNGSYVDELNEALSLINLCISKENDYSKFYMNKARIYALLGKYNEAKIEINHAIAKLPNSRDRNVTLSQYSMYYNSINASQNSSNIAKTLENNIEKQKIDNLKNITLMSTVISFLIGGIKAFENVNDYKIIAKIMSMYSGLFIFMIGLIFLISSLLMYPLKHKLLVNILSIIISLLGASIFIIMYFLG